MAITEGTTSLPIDTGGTIFQGNLAPDGNFYAPRADAQRNAKVSLWDTAGNSHGTTTSPLYIYEIGQSVLVLDTTAAWANSIAANVIVNTAVTLPVPLPRDARGLLEIVNPSAVTALALTVQTIETIAAVPYYFPLLTATINASTNYAAVITGVFGAEGLRIVLSNNTLLGGGEGFTALLRMRRV